VIYSALTTDNNGSMNVEIAGVRVSSCRKVDPCPFYGDIFIT
jgi:hypothetical protein